MSKLVRNIILFAVVIASTKTLASPPGDDFFIRFETSSPSDCATDTKMTHKILIGLKDSSMDRYEGQFEFLNEFQYIEAECRKPLERTFGTSFGFTYKIASGMCSPQSLREDVLVTCDNGLIGISRVECF